MDDILQDMKLTPADVEITVPLYYTHGRSEAFKARSKALDAILTKIGNEIENEKNEKPKMEISTIRSQFIPL